MELKVPPGRASRLPGAESEGRWALGKFLLPREMTAGRVDGDCLQGAERGSFLFLVLDFPVHKRERKPHFPRAGCAAGWEGPSAARASVNQEGSECPLSQSADDTELGAMADTPSGCSHR